MKKSFLTKTIAVAALSVTGLVAANNNNDNQKAEAAVIQNDATVYTTTTSTTVYNSYENPVATGQILPANTDWQIIQTAYDSQGQKWYDLGKNQWVQASSIKAQTTQTQVAAQTSTQSQNTQTQQTTTQPTYNSQAQSQQTYTPSSQTNQNYKTNYQNTQSYNVAPKSTTQTSSAYTSTATGLEASAKAWIANRESGGSYSATNGQYIGKYQLSASYLNGDYSAANQEKVADNYVKSRYGSWSAAKNFWQANGWY